MLPLFHMLWLLEWLWHFEVARCLQRTDYSPSYISSPILNWQCSASSVLLLCILVWIHSHSPFFLSWTNPSYFPVNCLEWTSGGVLLLDGEKGICPFNVEMSSVLEGILGCDQDISTCSLIMVFFFLIIFILPFIRVEDCSASCVITGNWKGSPWLCVSLHSYSRAGSVLCSETEQLPSRINIFLHFYSQSVPRNKQTRSWSQTRSLPTAAFEPPSFSPPKFLKMCFNGHQVTWEQLGPDQQEDEGSGKTTLSVSAWAGILLRNVDIVYPKMFKPKFVADFFFVIENL